MKVFLTGRNLGALKNALLTACIDVVDNVDLADLVITYGGDGAMLGAERAYPGKLKFPIRDIETAPLCKKHILFKQLGELMSGTLKTVNLQKLSGSANGRELKAINDVFIHNSNYVSAMRYNIWIDDELYGREIVGDGVGLSTILGATAYYRSITHGVFRTGIGLAFSNSTEVVNHMVLPETAVIRIVILRGPCELVADNSPERIELNEGDTAILKLSSETTPVLGLDNFMCPDCRNLRHDLRNTMNRGS